MELYPLKFEPVYSYRIWGGEKLKTVLNKQYDRENIGESWEISDIENNETIVSNGNLKGKTLKDLINQFKSDFLGNKVYDEFKDSFPLLIKFIDAKKPLSIQVHPSNELAQERHDSFGKNEMWFVMQAEENAELIVGFEREISKEEYKKHLQESTLENILNVEKVKKGDTFYIPTGRVHAIGAGVLLAEIQQTSNITYRIFDYDRVDKLTGSKRELHTELALDAIDYSSEKNFRTAYNTKINDSSKLVHSPYFKTNIIEVSGHMAKDYSQLDSFVIYMCVEGGITLEYEHKTYQLKMGETLLLPAIVNHLNIKSNRAIVLEVFL